MNEPKIINWKGCVVSIDRASRRYAIFNEHGIDLVRGFEPYTTEEEALVAATRWVDRHSTPGTDVHIGTIYPKITKVTMS